MVTQATGWERCFGWVGGGVREVFLSYFIHSLSDTVARVWPLELIQCTSWSFYFLRHVNFGKLLSLSLFHQFATWDDQLVPRRVVDYMRS
jgi:hypothetical protein